jgi:hypothetical protein
MIGDETTFKSGTIGRCNRCSTKFVLPHDCRAVQENARTWRLLDMCLADTCGHIDAHWVAQSDLEREQIL